MPNGQTIPISAPEKRILGVVKDELFPQIEKLKKLMVDLQNCRTTYQIFSKRLSTLEQDHSVVSKDFFEVVRKLDTPDILFTDLGDDVSNVAAYFKFQQGFKTSISEGVGYAEIVDRTLDRKLGRINNNRTLWLSLLAIVISIYFAK